MSLKTLLNKRIQDIHFRDVLKGGVLFILFRSLSVPAGFAFTWWVSRYYGADVLGVCTVLFSIWGLVEVAVNSSLKQYMVRNLAKLYQQQQITLYNTSVLRVLRLGIVLASVLSLLLMVFSARVAESFFDSSYASVIFYTAPVLLVLSVSSILQENLRLREKLKAFNFLSLASHGLFALLVLIVLHYTFSSLLNPLWAHLSAIGFTFILSTLFSVAYWDKVDAIQEDELPESYSSMFKIIAPLFVSAAAANVSHQIPLFFLSYFHDEKLAGVYAVLFTVSRLVSMPLQVINYNIAPKFVELLHRNKMDELQGLLNKNSRMLTVVSAFIFMVILIFPARILSLMGSVYGDYSLELLVLCSAQLVNVWAGSVNILMVTSGNEKVLSRFNATMLLLGTISGLMFISTHALFASIVIRAVMMAITNIGLGLYLYRTLHLRTWWWTIKKGT